MIFGKGIQKKVILFGKARGIKMYVDTENKIQRIIGADEREIQNTFAGFSKKCEILFDIGSSDAYYGLFYKKYNPSGQAYLFDADEKFKKIQEEHFELNNIKNGIHLYYKFVSNKNDEKNICLDSFNLKDHNVLFKIDVEGGELKVLEGIENMLKNNKCFLIIETHSRQLELDCIKFLKKNNFQTQIIKNAWWRFLMPEQRPLAQNRWLKAHN